MYTITSIARKVKHNFTCLFGLIIMEKTDFASHSRDEESIEAKARWFQSLSIPERMQLLCEFTDLALTVNPALADKKHAESTSGRVQVLIKSKRAAGRDIDLEDIRLLELQDEEEPPAPEKGH